MELKVNQKIDEVKTNFAQQLEMAKDEGKKVVGSLCSYFPREIVWAAGAISVGLCGTTEGPIEAAEKVLPADQCPMVKATYGRAINNTCPIFPLADVIVGETTCDGRKKMYELLAREKTMHVMDLPQRPEEPEAKIHWRGEIEKLKAFIEDQLDVKITETSLREAIARGNKERALLKAIHECRKVQPPPIMGLDLVAVSTKTGYTVDRTDYHRNLESILSELTRRIETGYAACDAKRPRILWTGLGNSLGCDKVLRLVEECGGVVVCQEGCGGVTRLNDPIDETKDPLDAIAERYLRVTCSCMTPNNTRFDDIDLLIRDFNIDGVIDLTWQSCHAFNIESYRVGELVREKHGIPFLHVVTDYSQSDIGQLKVRIEAFIEQILAEK
ncbi:MAG: 2-hydroxyacyl-CoA dehydratase [Desulfobacteraceae bacterium]|nr:2-hydroxyacyl-CoA dehydratase [Desulfobacteraceae bacterium]MBU4038069.1 2-hydroxyacyl-CoA dehydratase family protein [Pseudomonadota bacterium]